jgi:hypothetical protein
VAVSGGFLAVFWQFLDGLGRQSWAKEMLPGLKMSAKSLSLWCFFRRGPGYRIFKVVEAVRKRWRVARLYYCPFCFFFFFMSLLRWTTSATATASSNNNNNNNNNKNNSKNKKNNNSNSNSYNNDNQQRQQQKQIIQKAAQQTN